MQRLKRFLLCTILSSGIMMAPAITALGNTITEPAANDTEQQNDSTEQSDVQLTYEESADRNAITYYSANEIEETQEPLKEVTNKLVKEEVNGNKKEGSQEENNNVSNDLNQNGSNDQSQNGTDNSSMADSGQKHIADTDSEQTLELSSLPVQKKTPSPVPSSTSIKKTTTSLKSSPSSKTTLKSSKKTTTKSSSKSSSNTTTKKEAKVPKMYINVSKNRTNLLMQMMEKAPKDKSYVGKPIKITGKNRELLEALVYGEAGGEGFIGQCLVAQAIRDTMLDEKETSVAKIIRAYQYAGKTNKGTTPEVKDAVKFIFDDGGYVVQHRIVFFYAPRICRSRFHEKQKFIIEYKGHRFFDNSVWIERDNKNK